GELAGAESAKAVTANNPKAARAESTVSLRSAPWRRRAATTNLDVAIIRTLLIKCHRDLGPQHHPLGTAAFGRDAGGRRMQWYQHDPKRVPGDLPHAGPVRAGASS